MKRLLLFATVVALSLAVPALLPAQSNTQIGTWKLNLTKSKFNPGPAPKSETLTVTAQGGGAKYSFSGVAADGSAIECSFTTNFDGKESPASGKCFNGADTSAIKRVDANTITGTMKKAGKVVLTVRDVVSKDGKVSTATLKGTNEQGQPTSGTDVWDKQ
jgi:hypothetical protein